MAVIVVQKPTAARCVVLLSAQELLRDCGFVLCPSSLASSPLLSHSLLCFLQDVPLPTEVSVNAEPESPPPPPRNEQCNPALKS